MVSIILYIYIYIMLLGPVKKNSYEELSHWETYYHLNLLNFFLFMYKKKWPLQIYFRLWTLSNHDCFSTAKFSASTLKLIYNLHPATHLSLLGITTMESLWRRAPSTTMWCTLKRALRGWTRRARKRSPNRQWRIHRAPSWALSCQTFQMSKT